MDIFQSMDPETYEHDVYDELLTQAEIQGNINKVNGKLRVWQGYYCNIIIGQSMTESLGYNGNVCPWQKYRAICRSWWFVCSSKSYDRAILAILSMNGRSVSDRKFRLLAVSSLSMAEIQGNIDEFVFFISEIKGYANEVYGKVAHRKCKVIGCNLTAVSMRISNGYKTR